MVLVKRQQSCPTPRSNYYGGSSLLPMGNDEQAASSSSSFGYPDVRNKSSSSNKWILPLTYGLALLSWFSAFQCNGHLSQVSTGLQAELETLVLQKEQTLSILTNAKQDKDTIHRQHKKLKSTQHLFQHEMRMKEELIEMQTDERKKMFEKRQSGIAMTWVEQRQQALYSKIFSLQAFIQNASRQQVLAKYGPGPFNVEFTLRSHNGRTTGHFVVELAPLDLVPHSVQTFLDMVSNRLWENTVFYHHDTQHHVVAAAPVNYGTFETKHHHFDALGFTGVSFPEYAPEFPHAKYTIGFSGMGPNFYINTLDNSEHHGPGGQGHHDLPNDADPCFGKVISGQKVIEEMMMPGTHDASSSPVSWHDFDLTQIVKIQLLKE